MLGVEVEHSVFLGRGVKAHEIGVEVLGAAELGEDPLVVFEDVMYTVLGFGIALFYVHFCVSQRSAMTTW